MAVTYADRRGAQLDVESEQARLWAQNMQMRSLLEAIIENEPDDMAADGVTCLMVWRKTAQEILKD